VRRSDQRRAAVFALYERQVRGARPSGEKPDPLKPFTRELVDGVEENRAALDAEIGALAHGWDVERIAALERSILRVALFELHHRDDIPAEVAIDEAVGLAKRYCGAEAPGFVNGILAAAARAEHAG
jgi:transcription antitermination protein NusB